MTEHCWLLAGPEEGEKQIFLSQIKSGLTDKNGEAPETHRFYPFETSVQEILSQIKNGSLFAAARIFIIGQAELLKKTEADEFGAYLKNPSPDTVLVFLTDETSLKNGLGKHIPKKNSKIFWELFDNQKKGWLSGFFKNRRISIDTDAVELLLNLIENNTADMKRECEKLALFFGEGAFISRDEIETFFYHGKEENVFSLFNRIAAADFPGSVDILQKIMLGSDSNTVQLLSGLLWQLRNMLRLAREMEMGESFQSACFKSGIKGKKAQATYSEALKHYKRSDIERIISLTAEYDIKLRTARQEQKEITAQMYIYCLIEKKGRLSI